MPKFKSLDKVSIGSEATVKEALRKLDAGGERILFVLNSTGRLIGVITDGDIRRHILRDAGLNESVEACYNKSPVSFVTDYDPEEVKAMMIEKKIDVIPLVDGEGVLRDYITWEQIFGGQCNHSMRLDVPVVIMAGGKGTRLDPFTRILPKPLIPVGDKPIVENIMDRFHECGASDFYLTINYKGEMIKAYFDNIETPYKVNYIREDDFMGTAGSLSLLPGDFSETFILSNCDIIVELDYATLVDFHMTNGYPVTMVASMQHYRIPYGVIDLKKSGSLNSITEKPEYDFMVNAGLYVINREVLRLIPKGRPFHMTDLMASIVAGGLEVGVYPVGEKAYVDIGQWEEYRKNMERLLAD